MTTGASHQINFYITPCERTFGDKNREDMGKPIFKSSLHLTLLKINSIFISVIFIFGSCAEKKPTTKEVDQQIQKLSETLTTSETNDDLKSFLEHYTAGAISMPDYQAILQGMNEIDAFYKEIFQRQKIKIFKRNAEEIIHLDSTIIEIGNFTKEYTESSSDVALVQHGKYWNIWNIESGGNYKLKGEVFGYFHPIERPEMLVVKLGKMETVKSDSHATQQIPLELKAYNALMEKGVRDRDGILRAEIFTDDARFMPFADSTKTGMEILKPYMIAYNSAQVVIDTISVSTYHYEYLTDYILEYATFFVKWSVPELSGSTAGNGIRIWKRQKDKSLRLYREIGTHNYIP
jgi:hypothetical protein